MLRIQQAYVYVTCLVAIHMAVLGAANVLRVLAELGLQAPSGTFLGLAPDRSRTCACHKYPDPDRGSGIAEVERERLIQTWPLRGACQ